MTPKHIVAVIDYGSQYTQLIVRRVRELGYLAKLYALEDLHEISEPGAIILSGGPRSTSEPDAPDIDFDWLRAFGVPVLGVCYGMQLLNIKPCRLGYHFARHFCGAYIVLGKYAAIRNAKLNHEFFFCLCSYECYFHKLTGIAHAATHSFQSIILIFSVGGCVRKGVCPLRASVRRYCQRRV